MKITFDFLFFNVFKSKFEWPKLHRTDTIRKSGTSFLSIDYYFEQLSI